MVLLRSGLSAALAAFSLLGSTLAVSLVDKLRSLSPGARDILKRSTPAAPRFVVYSDAWVDSFPTPQDLKGYNVYALSFYLSSGPTDMAEGWKELTQEQRTSYIEEYNRAGISMIVSAFGSTDTPTSSGVDPVAIADELASWVREYDLQGIDIDYEDFGAFNNKAGIAERWLITLTQQLRKNLPQGEYILSHAPVAPWFSPNMWSGGGYLEVHKSVGYLIDWYNIQFYNQGTTEYTSCYGLIHASSSNWPESALFQISNNGVELDKLVIGKPGRSVDVNNGYMSLGKFAWCVSQAHDAGWDAGVMAWEWPYAPSNWITTVRGNSF
ncbi:glycoside hydrolase family 18 protein [Imleria badia]|nr:glycoside hydrolase family 18 protein [Imleria badia]